MENIAKKAVAKPVPGDPGIGFQSKVGVGLRAEHMVDILSQTVAVNRDIIGWFEVHTENYLCDGGPKLKQLEAIRAEFPLSFHGVSMSLGSAGRLDSELLLASRQLIDRFEPSLVSEHLSWCGISGETGSANFLNDLLPLPYTGESLGVMVDHVDETQEKLGRQILIENPSTYLRFANNEFSEAKFLTELARQTGCGLLLDINNIFVSARNSGADPVAILAEFSGDAVEEIHLGGYAINSSNGVEVLIDDHGSAVSADVWSLFDRSVAEMGAKPTLIEWDSNIPPFVELEEQASKANKAISVSGSL